MIPERERRSVSFKQGVKNALVYAFAVFSSLIFAGWTFTHYDKQYPIVSHGEAWFYSILVFLLPLSYAVLAWKGYKWRRIAESYIEKNMELSEYIIRMKGNNITYSSNDTHSTHMHGGGAVDSSDPESYVSEKEFRISQLREQKERHGSNQRLEERLREAESIIEQLGRKQIGYQSQEARINAIKAYKHKYGL